MARRGGRKAKYPIYIKPYLEQITEMAKTMTEKQIADCLGVSYTGTWAQSKQDYPELVEAIKKGRECVVSDLKSSLIKKAKGYEYTETKETVESVKWPEEMYTALLEKGFTPKQIASSRVVKTEKTVKHFQPDVAAINLGLKNYDKENWANDPQMLELRKQELEIRKKQIENNQW